MDNGVRNRAEYVERMSASLTRLKARSQFLNQSTMATNHLNYSANELMVCQAARQLLDREVVFVGIGLPNLACDLARRLRASNLVLIYESGAVGANPKRLPISIGDPSLVTDSLSVCLCLMCSATTSKAG